MHLPRKVGTCAYCGNVQGITRDHIPPRNLFPKPRSSDLITVPCCEACRDGWSDDDEYFRLHAISARVANNPSAQKICTQIESSLKKAKKKGFANMLLNNFCEVPIHSQGGIYLGHADALRIDEKRISRVMSRIVKGLFYEELGKYLPPTHESRGHICDDGFPDPLLKLLERIDYTGFSAIRTIQGGIFEYTYQALEEDCDTTLWLGSLYEKLSFFGVTRRLTHTPNAES
jgi:hypothetical protein